MTGDPSTCGSSDVTNVWASQGLPETGCALHITFDPLAYSIILQPPISGNDTTCSYSVGTDGTVTFTWDLFGSANRRKHAH